MKNRTEELRKELIAKAAYIIRAEAGKGGYLHDWKEYSAILDSSQQGDYFVCIAQIIAEEFLKVCKEKEMEFKVSGVYKGITISGYEEIDFEENTD